MLFFFRMFGREHFADLWESSLWTWQRDGRGNFELWLGRLHYLTSPSPHRARKMPLEVH